MGKGCRFTITGCPVPKGQASRRSKGREFALLKRWKAYRDGAFYEIKQELGARRLVPGKVSVRVQWWTPSNHRRDIDNALKAIFDVMVYAGVIEDDRCQVLRKIEAEWMGVDKMRPRVAVEVRGFERGEG